MKILTVIEHYHTSSTISSYPEKSLSTLSQNEKAIIAKWNTHVRDIKERNEHLFQEHMTQNFKRLDLKSSDVYAKNITTLSFLSVINDCFRSFTMSLLDSLQSEIIKKNQENQVFSAKDFFRYYDKNIRTHTLGISELQWSIIVHKSRCNQLYFYRHLIKSGDFTLMKAYGFIFKQDEKIIDKIPLETYLISIERGEQN